MVECSSHDYLLYLYLASHDSTLPRHSDTGTHYYLAPGTTVVTVTVVVTGTTVVTVTAVVTGTTVVNGTTVVTGTTLVTSTTVVSDHCCFRETLVAGLYTN